MWTENGIDLGADDNWKIIGDLALYDPEMVFEQIENKIAELLNQKIRVISLGGDHSITYPIMRSYGKQFPGLSILQLDAHPDLYDNWMATGIRMPARLPGSWKKSWFSDWCRLAFER